MKFVIRLDKAPPIPGLVLAPLSVADIQASQVIEGRDKPSFINTT